MLIFTGSIWSLVGAMLYAVYIVMIKRKVDREDKLDIPMFFGKNMFNLWGYLLWMISLGFCSRGNKEAFLFSSIWFFKAVRF